jgi:hypothetical protein
MKVLRQKRSAVLAGMIAAATVGAALFMPSAASANVTNPPAGSQPGNLTLSPASGSSSVTPTFSTSTGCPAGFQANATVAVMADDGTEQQVSGPVIGPNTPNPFSGTLLGSMGDVLAAAGPAGETYELVVDCHATPGTRGQLVQSTFVTYSADGNSWTSSATVPSGPAATTTTLTANPLTQVQGGTVTLHAAVSGTGVAGNVQFFNGIDSLGTVALSGGAASLPVTTLAAGDNSITAKFTPTDATKFVASTSNAVTVTIVASNGDTGLETLNVNVPLSEGLFVMTVSSTPVQLTDAVNKGTFFESTGTLSDVTVSDGRVQSVPGWSVSGQVSDFVSGANTIPGNDLGWTPQIKTPNANHDVTAGTAIAAGTNPGLKQGGGLAKADVNKGLGTTVLNAALDLQFPVDTKAGAYSATLTLTAVESAS